MRKKTLLILIGAVLIGAVLLGIGCMVFYSKEPVMTAKEAIMILRELDKEHIVLDSSHAPIKIIHTDILEHFERYQAGKEDIIDYPYIDKILIACAEKAEAVETDNITDTQRNEKVARHRLLARCLEAFAAEGCYIRDFVECCRLIGDDIEPEDAELITSVCKIAVAKSPHLVNKEDSLFEVTPLQIAAQYPTAEACKVLLAAGAEVDIRGKYGKTALMHAASSASVECSKVLLAAGANVNAKDDDGETPLMAAACNPTENACKACKVLLAAGADVDAKDSRGRTALMCAAEKSTAEVCKALIAAGAKVNDKDAMGRTALMCAANNPSAEVCKVLLAAGAKVNAKDAEGATALIYTVNAVLDTGRPPLKVKICKALIAAGADVNAKDNDGITPLIYAAKLALSKFCKALIAAGADVNAKGKVDGKTLAPLDYAVLNGNEVTVALLLRKGADIHLDDDVDSFIRNPDEYERVGSKHPNGRHKYQEVLQLLEEKINK